MAQVTIYVSDQLREQVKAAGINVSRVCQDALEAAVRFKEQQGVSGDSIRLQAPAITCPHPAKERTSYGVCRACGQTVKVKQ